MAPKKPEVKKPTIEEAVEALPENVEIPDPEQQAGVLVTKTLNSDGSVQVGVQLVGSAQITEIPFLLEKGLKNFREQFLD